MENERANNWEMTRREFIEILDRNGYSYRIEGETLIVGHSGNVWLSSLNSLPENVEFRNDGNVGLGSISRLPIEDLDHIFRNNGDIWLFGGWINDQEFLESRWIST
jgi:hypothetical protein